MDPIIKAVDVQYCTLQCPDLDVQEQFLIHFGMHTVEKTDNMLLMRGEGPQPFIEKCIKGEKKFLSASFLAASMDDQGKSKCRTPAIMGDAAYIISVSYTHLTLPTIYSV